jgi:argininosuccinate lyase
MAKMWAGRFGKDEDASVNDFNSSVGFDARLYAEDIAGSIAHAQMLGKTGIIPAEDAEKITGGLKGILSDLESGTLKIDSDAEDIHMFIEQVLTERIGAAGKKLHTARSRNDQVALDVRIFVKKSIASVKRELIGFSDILVSVAEKHKTAIMPGYTHLQRAQPVTFGHYMMAYAEMFGRDITRLMDCYKRADVMPLGSAALAGTSYPIDRGMVAQTLGFSKVGENSLDGVSDRDFVIEFVFCLSVVMMHLSRLAEEVVLWTSAEFKFLELDDGFATGSSIMPQKKNPDVAELVRGKTGRVYGDLTALLTVMKGLPLAYNKDMQEDKESLFDAVDTVLICLPVFGKMLATAEVLEKNMEKAAEKGFINATDAADYLAKKGMPFRDAYKVSGGLVAECIKRGVTLNALPIEVYKEASGLFEADVYDAIKLSACVEKRASEGGPAYASVTRQITEMKEFLKNA